MQNKTEIPIEERIKKLIDDNRKLRHEIHMLRYACDLPREEFKQLLNQARKNIKGRRKQEKDAELYETYRSQCDDLQNQD